MAVSWITALKLIPWGEVIEATPQVVKAAKGLLRKKDDQAAAAAQAPVAPIGPLSHPQSSGEHALQLIQLLEQRVSQLEQSQRQSLELIETLAEQNTQIVATVGLLRTGAQRLAWAVGILAVTVLSMGIYLWRL